VAAHAARAFLPCGVSPADGESAIGGSHINDLKKKVCQADGVNV
jgi:hypothetical protein